jgi:acetoin utilization protein AcuB
MKIESLMTRRVVTVDMDDTLATIRTIFSNTTFHHLLVVGESKLVGVISDRDLLKALSPKLDTAAETERDRASLNKKAHQIMTRNPVVLGEQASIKEALTIFNQHSISCIPIVNTNGEPVGILSWRDILREWGNKLIAGQGSDGEEDGKSQPGA